MLTGALPLLESHGGGLEADGEARPAARANSAKASQVIRTVRSYVSLLTHEPGIAGPRDAIDALRNGVDGDHSAAVLSALEQVAGQTSDESLELAECGGVSKERTHHPGLRPR